MKLYGLDLFSGIGGNSLALAPWVRTVAYCEQDRYAQAVLLSRMAENSIGSAPIWDDVQTLKGSYLPRVDIIVGGFPCQDISVAGHGRGLEGERSGLYWQIHRLAKEIQPPFLFLENVPAIRTRGLDTVVRSLSELGYDCRWTLVSAAEIGAPHKRDRWFLLAAHAERLQLRDESGRWSRTEREGLALPRNDGAEESLANSSSYRRSEEYQDVSRCSEGSRTQGFGRSGPPLRLISSDGVGLADTCCERLEGPEVPAAAWKALSELASCGQHSWPSGLPQPTIGRGDDGFPNRMDRLKCLGNAVVPAQARTAFCRLMGFAA